MSEWRDGSCYLFLSTPAWQLESPWRHFCLRHTHTHSHPKVSSCSWVDTRRVRLSLGRSEPAFGSTLCLFSHPPFLFLCRFCTAAADRKLRLLTSDLQDKHEVKVAQHLEHTAQNYAAQLASGFLYFLDI